ncbi:MAG: hypothetical protein ACXVJD_17905, partial [Mucilaginibacter sp.]
MRYLLTVSILALGLLTPAMAQQKMKMGDTSGHHHPMMKDTPGPHMMMDTARYKMNKKMKMPKKKDDMVGTDMSSDSAGGMMMSSAQSKNLPMDRNGSGTSWLPDASPMYGIMLHSGEWMYMVHGNIALRYTNQDFAGKGSRGSHKVDAPNWFMGMAQR